MEQNMAKKLWKIVRVALCMLRKGISKQKLMLDLKLIMKRSKIGSYKAAVQNLHFHHRRSHVDSNLPFSPRQYEYEFSCSNSPCLHQSEDVMEMNAAVMKALEMIKSDTAPSPDNYLPESGRVTVRDDEEELEKHVDEAADEFISKFYRNLRRQSSLNFT